MIEITCDRVQMMKLMQIFEDSEECLLSCIFDDICECDYELDCVRCLSKNIKWNIID